MPKAASTRALLQELHTLLETITTADGSVALSTIQPFLVKPLENVRAALKRQTKAKKEPNEAEAFPEYKVFVDLWHRYYPHMLDMPRDGKNIKEIIKKTRAIIEASKDGSIKATPEKCAHFFEIFLQKLPTTWFGGKNLSMVNSHYTSIIFEMKNGKSSKPSARDSINAL